jgi:hypothetical protein
MTRKPVLCLDFDGVLHSYSSRWQGAAIIPDPPVPGAYDFIIAALSKFDVCVLSSRSHEPGGRQAMAYWMVAHFGGVLTSDVDDGQVVWSWKPGGYGLIDAVTFPLHKPPALVTIDDRALTFTGLWPSVDELLDFRPWNKEGALADVEVPAEGTEERDFWLEAARQHGIDAVGPHGCYEASEDAVLALMAAAREQGRRDVLGLPPKEPK